MLRRSFNTVPLLLRLTALSLALSACSAPPAPSATRAPAVQPLAAGDSVSVWRSVPSANEWLTSQPGVSFAPDATSSTATIIVDEGKTFQTMDGFGASLTGTSAYNIFTKLSAAKRDALMTQLFSPTGGIGLSFLRQPMGASDLSVGSFYTYDDVPSGQSDPNLAQFSIEPDRAYILPVVKQALQLNPNIKVLASPWSPPAWMKTGSSLIASQGGSLKTDAYAPYANYFVKFIRAYEAEGIPIYAVTIQNEPGTLPSTYPGLNMTASEQANFLKNNLGPTFASNNVSAKILVQDWHWGNVNFALSVLNDPAARAYADGAAFHRYSGDPSAQSRLKRAFPDQDVYFTEGSTDTGISFTYLMQTLMINNTRNWAKTVVLWNIAADENNGPSYCPACRPLLNIDTASQTWTLNPDYRALAHFSKFITPGAVRIGSNTLGNGSIDNVAFKNPDGSKVLVAINSGSASKTFKVKWGNDAFDYTLPAGAAATFKWSGTPSVASVNAFERVEAETYNAMSGVDVELTSDTGGGENVGYTDDGDSLVYRNVNFGSGAASLSARVASNVTSGTLEFRLDSASGPLIASLVVANTGGWQTWQTKTALVNGASGVHDLYVLFKGGAGVANLNWFNFTPTTASGTQLFFDDFEDGAADGWTPSGGTWSVCQVGTNSKEYCKTSTDAGLSIAGNAAWSNYAVQAYLIPSDTNGSSVALLGRVQSASGFYQLELKRSSGGVKSWELYKNVSGTWTRLTGGNYTYVGGAYLLLRLDLNGSSLTASVSSDNGATFQTLGSASDATFSAGKIGVRAVGVTTRYDQVKVVSR